MRPILAMCVLALTAWHTPAASQPLPDRYDDARFGSYRDSDELRATVWFDEYTGVASFDLSRPGHVAVFALEPLGRMEMIYPTWGRGHEQERAFRSGRHSVRTDSRLYHLAMDRSRSRSARGVSGQTYIILIASDRPLRLDPILATGTAGWLNHPSITWNPFVATDYLAREIVPGYQHADWTVAYHVVWPAAAGHRYDGRDPYAGRDRYTRVRCPGNVVISVRTDVVRSGQWYCPSIDRGPDPRARPRGPRVTPIRPSVPPITDALPGPSRPGDRTGAPGDDDRRAVPRTRGRVSPADRRTTAPAPRAQPTGTRPAPEARPAPRPAPAARPRPAAKPGGAVRPAPAKPKPKPKKDGGGKAPIR